MIVTCPGCGSKYRVRNEAVPADGARMRCPKCETMFLAKPPPSDTPHAGDDASSTFAQLQPSPNTTNPDAPKPSGPLTAMFQAFDSSTMPMPRAPGAAPAGAAPSGREQEVPQSPPRSIPQGFIPVPPPRAEPARPGRPATFVPPPPAKAAKAPTSVRNGPSRAAVVASWASLGIGSVVVVCGGMLFAWTLELADLDAAWMPRFEKMFDVSPPRSTIGRDDIALDDLRRDAVDAQSRGDLALAVVTWRAVKDKEPNDPRAQAAIAKLLSELGDLEGAR